MLALVLVLSMLPAGALRVHAEEATAQEETLPTDAAADETVPETTAAAETIPKETLPATEPPVTEEPAPTETVLEETVPVESIPEETQWVIEPAVDAVAALTGSCGENVTWSLCDGVLTIRGEGPMGETNYNSPWAEYEDEITTVIIEEGVTTISACAFRWFSKLTSVSLPDGLLCIGMSAFEGCEALASIDIPDSVTEIEMSTFSGCASLKSVHIPAGITEISDLLFSTCFGLQEVTFGGEITSIGDWAFGVCDFSAFTIPDTVTSIGSYAFTANSDLQTIAIPAGVTSIGNGVFSNCSSMTYIEVADENPNYCDVDGALFNKDCTELLLFPAARKGSYTVPRNLTVIGNGAFRSCRLSEIIISEGVEEIEAYAFETSSIKSVHIPASVTSISSDAFYFAWSMSSIQVADENPNYCDVDGVLFNKDATTLIVYPAGREGLYRIPSTATTLGANCFESSKAKSITVPASVNYLGSSAFFLYSNWIIFEGDAPVLSYDSLDTVFFCSEAKIYYPENNETWDAMLQKEPPRDDAITWIPYGEEGAPVWPNDGSTWDTAEALTLEQPHPVDFPGSISRRRYTFTPEADGYYIFYTTGKDAEFNLNIHTEITDNTEGYSHTSYEEGRIYLMRMRADQTYSFDISSYNDIGFRLTVEKSDIVSVELVPEFDIYEHTRGYWTSRGYYYYYGPEEDAADFNESYPMLSYTVTYADGTEESGCSGSRYTMKWHGYDVDWYISEQAEFEQSAASPWLAGNSYNIFVYLLGSCHTLRVNILEGPENITISPDPIIVPQDDYYITGDWSDDYEEYKRYRYYNWDDHLTGTVTIDGIAYPFDNDLTIIYDGVPYPCQVWAKDNQSAENEWQVGGTYEVTIGILGAEVTCTATVFDEWAGAEALTAGQSVTVDIPDGKQPVHLTFTPEEDGYYLIYSAAEGLDPAVTAYEKQESHEWETIGHADDSFDDSNFMHVMHLAAGKTYGFAVKVLGAGGSFPVTLEKSDITHVELSSEIDLYEYTHGHWGGDEDEFYYYEVNAEQVSYIITHADGTQTTGNGGYSFKLDGRDAHAPLHLESIDYQWGEEHWTAGNSYRMNAEFLGDAHTVNVNILEAPEHLTLELKPILVSILEYETRWDDGSEWIRYPWEKHLSGTITIDGTAYTINEGSFYYDAAGYECWLWYKDDQKPDNVWVAGNTYTATVGILGMETPCEISLHNPNPTIDEVDYDIPEVYWGLAKPANSTTVQVRFEKVAGAARYDIYLDGAYYASTKATSYKFTGLKTGESHTLQIAAVKTVNGKNISGPLSHPSEIRAYIDMSKYHVAMEYTSTVYDGTAKQPSFTLKTSSSGKLMPSESYIYEYSNNVEVGQALLGVGGAGQYGGYIYKSFRILPQQVTGLQVTELTNNTATITFEPVHGAQEYWIYNGNKVVAKITDTSYTFTGLKLGTTYNFAVQANAVVEELVLDRFDVYTGAGLKVQTVNYTGAISETVSVRPASSLENFTVVLTDAPKAYTGKALTPTVKLLDASGKALANKKDFAITCTNHTEVGTATLTITGVGKYEGTITTTFDIVPPKAATPVVTLLDGVSAQVSFKAVKQARWYEILVDGELHSRTTDLSAVVSGLTPGKNHKFTVRAGATVDGKDYVGAQSGAKTAMPRHNMSICDVVLEQTDFIYTGEKLTPAVTVTGHKGVVLTEKVDYTVSYTNNTNTGIATVTVTGKGAYTGKTTATFTIYPAKITGLKVKSTTTSSATITFTKSSSAQRYNIYLDGALHGSTTGNTYTFKNLVLSEIHDVHIVPEKTVKNVRYEGAPSDVLQIWAGTDIARYNVTMEYSRADYAGEPLCPNVIVKVSSKKDALVLERDVDYIVEYIGNNAPGKASVVIKGIGKYAGTITKTFNIFMVKPMVMAFATGKNSIYVEFAPIPGATEY